jgi:cytidine deaminase
MAADAATQSYSPYSGFRVGAVVVSAEGTVFTGANIENAAYGATVCAETNAVTTAVAAGARKIKIVAVACLDGSLCTPCGNCLQVLSEFGVETVILRDADGSPRVLTLEDLLPMSFGPEALA